MDGWMDGWMEFYPIDRPFSRLILQASGTKDLFLSRSPRDQGTAVQDRKRGRGFSIITLIVNH